MFKRIVRTLTPFKKRAPLKRLSVVLVCYKMDAQIGNTLRSLVPPYQQKIKKQEYDILVMDNGSPQPLPEEVWKIASNVRYHYIPPGEASLNPGVALNHGVRLSTGDALCVMIDGARMVTPGVLSWGLRLLDLAPRGVVEVRSWHLGPKFQPESIMEGYNHKVEKQMLLDSRWWENGYRLFDISAAPVGFLGRAAESNCVFLPRALYDEIGGYGEGYKEPGGGLVNLDFYSRALAAADHAFTLLGEGTFHQVHGGAATGLTKPQLTEALARWQAESDSLRGSKDPGKKKRLIMAGHVPPECCRWLRADQAEPGLE